MAKKQSAKTFSCPVEAAMEVFGSKSKAVILWWLTQRTHRFAEICRRLPDVSEKLLSQQLRELESDELIARRVYNTVPPKVEFSLTEYGHSLKRPLAALGEWGKTHIEKIAVAKKPAATKQTVAT